jgi:rhodanese-related sulfurtransferase
MQQGKLKKHLRDGLSLVLLAVVGFYFLYQKGYIFVNFEKLEVKEAYALLQKEPDSVVLLDVRTQKEYLNKGRLEGAMLIPLGALRKNLSKLEPYRDKKILIYCRSGARSVSASRILSDAGFKPYNINGGINEWRDEGLPIQ